MAGLLPYDMLREGGSQVPDLRAEADLAREAAGVINPEVLLDTVPVQVAKNNKEAAYLQRLGYVPNGNGGFVDPERIFAQDRKLRYDRLEQQMKQRQEQIANSMLFKVGDTLADTGRMFLSPLFWLKGEDQSQYDPSDRLKTGYRNQFESLEALRAASVQKFTTARDVRLAATTNFENSRANQRIQMMSPEQKAIYGFAQTSPERMALYNENDPALRQAAYDKLRQEYNLKELGKGLQLTDSQGQQFYLSDNEVSAVDRASKAFVDETKTLREGFNNIQQLLAVDENGTGITDVAAIFAFIKGIDPGSVVRESEVQLFQQTLSLIDQIELQAKKVGSGRLLSSDQIKELKRYANALGEAMGRKFNDRKQIARQQLSSLGLTSEELQNNYLGGYDAPMFDQETTTGPTGAVPAGGAVDQLLNQGIDALMKLNEGQTPPMMQGVSGAAY
jgi:hypothetical protein